MMKRAEKVHMREKIDYSRIQCVSEYLSRVRCSVAPSRGGDHLELDLERH